MDRKPTLKEIQKFVVPHVSEIWEELGIELELDDDGTILDGIRQARNKLPSKCCLDVLKTWLQGAGVEPKTWRKLLECLEARSCPEAERAIASVRENILDGLDGKPSSLSGGAALSQQVLQKEAQSVPKVGHTSLGYPQSSFSELPSVDSSKKGNSCTKSQDPASEATPSQSEQSGSDQFVEASTISEPNMAASSLSSTPPPTDESAAKDVSLDYSLRLQPPLRVRDYQWELAAPGIAGENYIVCLPTGTGKTLIAALIISEHLKKQQGEGKTVFLVNTRPLAQQQKSEIEKFIPGASVQCCTGEDVSPTVKLSLEHCDIIVCTAGKLLDELKDDTVHLSEISLMVFDECHHTRKNTPYANIMARYLEEAARAQRLPQVIGLTASPGAGTREPDLEKTIDYLITLCAHLNATGGIKVVKDNVAELEDYTNKPTSRLMVFDPRDPSDRFVSLITAEMKRLEGFTSLQCHFDRWSQQYETSIQGRKGALEMSTCPENRDQIAALELLRHFTLVLSIYMDLRYEDAISVLNEYDLPSVEQATTTEQGMSRRLDTLKYQLSTVARVTNPLLKEVEDIISKRFSHKPESRGIMFVRTKKHALCLRDWVAQLPARMGVHPAVLTGHTRQTGPGQGMTEVEQTQVIQGFQKGQYNLLIATSVAEEGLDVPACNLVIRFQHVSNEIAKVQTLGRARASGAEGFTVLASDSNKKFQELKNAELEKVVEQAVHKYFPEGRALVDELRERQKKLVTIRAMKQELRTITRAAHSRENVQLLCKKCKVVACRGTDIYTVENQTHYVVADEVFKATKIKVKPHHTPTTVSDKVKKTHKIYCRNCDADWGVIFTWPAQGHEFPILKCIRFIFEVNGYPRAVTKWSAAQLLFDIPPLSSRPEFQQVD